MRLLGLVVAAALALPAAGALFPLPADASQVDRAAAWLLDRERPEGCIGAEPTGPCGHASTRDAVLALSAAGVDPAGPLAYLGAHRGDLENETGGCPACKWAKTIVAIAAAGGDPRRFHGYDYVARLDREFDGVQAGSPAQVNDDAWALFAYASVDDPPRETVDALRLHLEARQNAVDGGWAWNLAPASEAWGTATVLLALLQTGTGTGAAPVRKAVDFLHTQQRESGLIEQDDADSAESTAITIQALRSAGEDPAGAAWTRGGATLIDALLGLHAPDGSFKHNAEGGSRFVATTQVLPALRGVPYPFRPPGVSLEVAPASGPVGTEFRLRVDARDPDGSVERIAWWIDDAPAGTGTEVLHRFDTLGTHAVRVLVEDDDGVARWARGAVLVGPGEEAGPVGPAASRSVVDEGAGHVLAEPRASAKAPAIGALASGAAMVVALASVGLRRRA